MSRRHPSRIWLLSLLLAAPVTAGQAIDLPTRKPGLWELKMQGSGSGQNVAIQHCTDETIDKKMNAAVQPLATEACSAPTIQKTATGYTNDSVCKVAGMTTTSHAEITGDFNSAYTVEVTSHNENPLPGVPKESATTLDAKWLGPCKDGQKPGDIVMPGGIKMNIADMDKLKALLPKSK